MDKLLITGVESAHGSNLLVSLSDRFEAVGVTTERHVAVAGCRIVAIANQAEAHAAAIRSERPKWAIHCGTYSANAWNLRTDHVDSLAADVARAIAAACAEVGAQLTLLSTDAVFDCPGIFHDEHSMLLAAHAAGQTALAVEAAVPAATTLIVRTHAYGWSGRASHAGFAQHVYDGLQQGVPGLASAGRYATPILASDLADLLVAARERRLTGVHHLAGAERTHMDRFVKELASVAANAPRLAVDTLADPVAAKTDRQETSLNSRLARRALELPMPLLREGLQRFVAQRDAMLERVGGQRAAHAA